MKKKQTAKEIARLFEEKISDANLISDIFDYLQFDCKIGAFIDPNKLDGSIKRFYELQTKRILCKKDLTFVKKSSIIHHINRIKLNEISRR